MAFVVVSFFMPLPPLLRMPAYSVVLERDDDGWIVGSVPDLPGCHTQARTVEELRARIVEAIQLYIEEHGAPATRKFLGVQQVEVEV